MKKYFVLSFLLSCSLFCFSQAYKARYKIWIPEDVNVIRMDKILCEKNIPPGYIIKEEYKLKNKQVEFTINRYDTLNSSSRTLEVLKNQKINLGSFSGWANVRPDNENKSTLHINYWLDEKHKLDPGTKITIHKRSLNCDSIAEEVETLTKTLEKKSVFYLERLDVAAFDISQGRTWFKTSPLIIDVYDKDGKDIEYYLVEKYDNKAEYIVSLENRQFISWKYRSWDLGPVTIPFKYRPGFEEDGIEVDSEFRADLNLGIYVGRSFGLFRYRYESEELKELSKLAVTVGPFLSLSSVTLDSISTRAGDAPIKIDETRTMAVWSPGLGLMFTIYNFQVGSFIGWDFGAGSNAQNWNYNKKLWLGIGLSYSLSYGFWKKEE